MRDKRTPKDVCGEATSARNKTEIIVTCPPLPPRFFVVFFFACGTGNCETLAALICMNYN